MIDDLPSTVTRSVDLDAGVEQAWDLVGTTGGLAAWLGHDVEADLAPGGVLSLRDADGTPRTGTVTEVRPGEALTFRWAAEGEESTVTIRVDERDGGGSRVTVTEVAAGARALACAEVGAAWDQRLLGLELGALVAVPAFAAVA